MASSESVPSSKRHGQDHQNVSGICGLLPVDDQEENDGISRDQRYGSRHPDDRPNNLDLNYWRPCLSSHDHHQVKKRNQERELEKHGNTAWRLESAQHDRNQMQDRDSSGSKTAGAIGGPIAPKKQTDCNYLVTRLVKLRACLSQAFKASEKCSKRVDAKGIKKFEQLSSVVKQLKEEEEFCLNLLQTLLAFRNSESQNRPSSDQRFEEPEDSDAENNGQEQEHDQEPEREQDVNSSVSENEQMDDAERTRNEVLSFMSQKHELFYRLLQEQEPSPLSSQEELSRAEGDLKSCTSWDEGLKHYKPTSHSLKPGFFTRPALSSRSLDGTCVKEEEDLSAGSAQMKEKSVRNRCETKEEASCDRVNSTDRRDHHLVVEHLGQQEHLRLEEKLRRLDEKKRNMNEMLQKLHSLRMERSFLNNELASVAAVEVRELGCDRGGKFSSSQFPCGFAEEAASSNERCQTRRKLEISNEHSDVMRGFYETSEEFPFGGDDHVTVEAIATGVEADVDFEPAIVGNDWTDMLNSQCNVYRRENNASATSGHAGKSLNRKGELDAKVSPGRSEMKAVKRLEDQKAEEDEGCAQLQEKMRQLIGTKETLNNLKQLVVLVRQSPDLTSCTADNMMGFPKDLVTSCSLEEERGEDVVGKFQRQQSELTELMEEHQRLLELQVELERIQETQPKEPVDSEGPAAAAISSSAIASQVLNESSTGMHNSVKHLPLPMASSAAKMSSESTQVKFQDPIETVVSNEELYGRMRQQRMLREELLEKKKELQQMMQKDKSLKQNICNEVTQSDNVFYYNRSDQCRASPSEDITTATWGGSTAGNLESMGETENRSCKEDNDNDYDNKDDDDVDEGKTDEGAGFHNNRTMQAGDDEEEYSNDGDDDATGQEFEDAHGTDDAIGRSQVSKNSSLPNACFRRRFLPLKLPTANVQRESVANGDDANRGDGTYCIDNDSNASRIVRPIINSLSVPAVRHVSQNTSQHVAQAHKTASFAGNTKEHGLSSRMMGNNRQVIRKNHFSHQRKHQNNVYNRDDNDMTVNDETGLSALCNEMKLLKGMISSLIRSLSGKRSPEEDAQIQHNQLFFGLNKCFLQLLSSQNAMAERLNQLEKMVLNNFGTRETIIPMERFHDGGQGDSQSPGVKPLPKLIGRDPLCGWKAHFSLAGRKNSLSSESSKVENEAVVKPDFRALQRNKRRSPGQQRQPVPRLLSYPSIVSSVKDGSDLEESVPIKTIHASDMGITNFETCAVPHINPPQLGTCFVRKWGDGMNCGDIRRMPPKQNNSSLTHAEKQCGQNLSKRRIWERGNNDGDLSTSEFAGQVRAPEFVHVKNRFSDGIVSSGGASSLAAIHRVSANYKSGRAGSAPAQRSPGTSYERGSFTFLQETIYSEVGALVAQNEHCPHYLIRLFQELQLLSTDILRQRALLAIQDIVARGAAVDQKDVTTDGVSVGCNASDELQKSYVGGLEKTDLKGEFDYAEGVDSGSSLSTPHSTTAVNNHLSLNDTVIQRNNALKWMKAEEDRMEEQDLIVASDEQFGQSLAMELLHLVDDDDDDDDNESTVDGTHDTEINADAECSSCVATTNRFQNIDQSENAVQLHIQHDVYSASEVEPPEPTGDKLDEGTVAETDDQQNETKVADETANLGYCAKEKELGGEPS